MGQQPSHTYFFKTFSVQLNSNEVGETDHSPPPASNAGADGTVITVPEWPVKLWTYYFAVRERGEDRGTALTDAREDAENALISAIQIDTGFDPSEQLAKVV